MTPIQAFGKFINETVNEVNEALAQFQQHKIKNSEPRFAQYFTSQNNIITNSMNSLKSQIAEIRNEMKSWDVDSFIIGFDA
jgi:hypothetical protein